MMKWIWFGVQYRCGQGSLKLQRKQGLIRLNHMCFGMVMNLILAMWVQNYQYTFFFFLLIIILKWNLTLFFFFNHSIISEKDMIWLNLWSTSRRPECIWFFELGHLLLRSGIWGILIPIQKRNPYIYIYIFFCHMTTIVSLG